MDYNQTDLKNFIESYEFLLKELPKAVISKAFISIGSNLLIDFGSEKDAILPNGKPYKKTPWCMHLGSGGAWRLSQNNYFLIGSSDSIKEMNTHASLLVGRKCLSIFPTSQFMDIQIIFEGGFQIDTFLDSISEEQWVLLCSNGNSIKIECETKTQLRQIQKLSSHFNVKNMTHKMLNCINGKSLIAFNLRENCLRLEFEGKFSLHLDACMWRLERNNIYCIGSTDHIWNENEDRTQYFDDLKGNKLVKSSLITSFQDARFEFEGGYVIKTFSCYKDSNPWRILKDNKENIYSANMLIANI